MDVQRQGGRRKRLLRIIVWSIGFLILISAVSIAVARLKPAVPAVEWSTVWLGTVERGPMVLDVRGSGTLVSEDTLFIPAMTDGRVEKVLVEPGAELRQSTVIAALSNPDLNQQALDAESQVKMAEAKLEDLEVTLASDTLSQKVDLGRIESDYNKARIHFARDEKLYQAHLISELDFNISKSDYDDLERQMGLQKERVGMRPKTIEAQIRLAREQIENLRAMADLKKSQVGELQVRAGVVGILQELSVQVGAHLTAGTVIAKVVQPGNLKAALQVPETQMKDIHIGEKAAVDTRNGIVAGRVWRIDPAAKDGSVTVDIKLDGALPSGARPDLTVDGDIEIARMSNVVFVGRPASAAENQQASLFRINPDGKTARRVPVRFGRASVNSIEIVDGLQPGDRVILSDLAAGEGHDIIQLK